MQERQEGKETGGLKLKELFGERIWVQKDGQVHSVDASQLAGKTIGIYFSAHWCPPCRRFTPHLAQVYKAVKRAGKSFEVVFVSGDRTEEAFKEYFSEMPWVAADRKVWPEATSRYGVQGIPRLVILDSTGNVINEDALQQVRKDPAGQDFPWPGNLNPKKPKADMSMAVQLIIVMILYAVISYWMGKRNRKKEIDAMLAN